MTITGHCWRTLQYRYRPVRCKLSLEFLSPDQQSDVNRSNSSMTSSSRDLELAATRVPLGTIGNMFDSRALPHSDRWCDDLINIPGFGAMSSDTSDVPTVPDRGHLVEAHPRLQPANLASLGADLFISHPLDQSKKTRASSLSPLHLRIRAGPVDAAGASCWRWRRRAGSAGGTVSASQFVAGLLAGGSGNINIEEAGSELRVTNDATPGAGGVGVLTLGRTSLFAFSLTH